MSADNDEWVASWLTQDAYANTYKPIKCECGTSIVLAKDDHGSLHSDYCPVYERWKADEHFRKIWELPKGEGS